MQKEFYFRPSNSFENGILMAGEEQVRREGHMIITQLDSGDQIIMEMTSITGPHSFGVEGLTWTRLRADGTEEQIHPFDMENDELVQVFENLYGSNIPEYILHSETIPNNPARIISQEFRDRGTPTEVIQGPRPGVRTEIFGELDIVDGSLLRATPEAGQGEPLLGTYRVYVETAPNDFIILDATVWQDEHGLRVDDLRWSRGNEFASREISVESLTDEELVDAFREIHASAIPREILQNDPRYRTDFSVGRNPLRVLRDEYSVRRPIMARVEAAGSDLRAEIFGSLSIRRGDLVSTTTSYFRGDRLLPNGLVEAGPEHRAAATPDEVRGLIRGLERLGGSGQISESTMWTRIRPLAGMLSEYTNWADPTRTREPYAIIDVPGREGMEGVHLELYVSPTSLQRHTMRFMHDDGSSYGNGMADLTIEQLNAVADAIEHSQLPQRFLEGPQQYVVAELQQRGEERDTHPESTLVARR